MPQELCQDFPPHYLLDVVVESEVKEALVVSVWLRMSWSH